MTARYPDPVMGDPEVQTANETRPRNRSRFGRWSSRLARAGTWFGATVFGLLFVLSCAIGVAQAVAASEPVSWGTFTSERCEPSRFGCTNVGTWVSDDGSIRKHDIQLDGALTPVVTVRASHRPTGPMSDEGNNIVHAEFWSTAGLWLPWVLAVCCGAWTVVLLPRLIPRSRARSSPIP